MAVHPLDNPMWSSLTSLHRVFAVPVGGALTYPAEVAPFLAVPEEGVDGAEGERFGIGPAPRGQVKELGTLVQMICEQPLDEVDGPPVVPLGEAKPVLELTALVYPHYFRPRTMELGRYFGVMIDGRLAAMAGERLGMPGFREVSAVCTHPDFVGRGLARRLLAFLSNDILRGGAVPFLHVSPKNTRALELYRQSGYRVRAEPRFWGLQRSTSR